MSEFKVPNPKSTYGKVLGLGLLGGLGILVWAKLVPFLATMAWNTVSLAVAVAAIGILGSILLSKKFWRRLNIILEALGNIAFGWIIEMNPFTILEMQLDRSERDRADLLEQKKKLEGQKSKLDNQLKEQNGILTLSAKKVQMCQKMQGQGTEEDQINNSYDLEAATTDYNNAEDFINKVAPIAGDIARLVTFADKAYVKSGFALRNARTTLKSQRAAYEAVTTGSNAVTKALRAFTGDPEMNNAAEIALAKLRTDISNKIGTIKVCIAETSKIMNERDLNDAAKVALAADNIEKLNIDKKFDLVKQIELKGEIATPVVQNKWLNTLKQK